MKIEKWHEEYEFDLNGINKVQVPNIITIGRK